MLKKIIKLLLSSFGYELRKKYETGFYASYLSRLCDPKTVFDVGVGHGTYELYKAFPAAKFFLIEPLKEFQTALDKISSQYNCTIYNKAVGNSVGIHKINVETHSLQLSSLNYRPERSESDAQIEQRDVEITTLDTILRENPDIGTPILIKIDTEGHELCVLKGAKNLLAITDIVILEVSIAKRFISSYTFEELTSFMANQGFAVFDFLSLCYVKGQPGVNLADVVFKRKKY